MKKLICILSALAITLSLLTVSAFANPFNSTLTKQDFNYSNGSDRFGYDNYIDSIAGRSNTSYWLYENKHSKDYDLGYANLYTRDVGLGSTKSDVFKKFGTQIPQKVYQSDERDDEFDSIDVPVEKVTYKYTKTGRSYYQSYYFDDEGSVCLIVWYNAAANS